MSLTKEEIALGSAPIGGLFVRYSTPTVVGMMMVGMLSIIDGIFVGNFIGTEALASVNLAMPIYGLVIAIGLVFGIGAITLISTNLGRRDYTAASNALKTAFVALSTISLTISCLVLLNLDSVVNFLGATEQLHPMVCSYLWGITPFFFSTVITFLGDFTLKASGKPMQSVMIMSTVVVINILLDYLLIAHFELGLFGAGLATGISCTIGVIIHLTHLLSRKSLVSLRSGKFDFNVVGRMAYNGSSEGVSDFSKAIIAFILNGAMITLYGSDGVAALTTISYIQFVGITIYLGISDGIVPIISYNYGARKSSRIAGIVRYGLFTNIVGGLVFFTILFFFATDVACLFFDNATISNELLEVVNIGGKIIGVAFLFNGSNILMSASFTALHCATESMLIAASRGLIFTLIATFVVYSYLSAEYIWYIIPFAELMTLIIFAPIFAKRLRKTSKDFAEKN